ncbi:LacI family DNA-binding transcriptional regulator [Streptomyces hoynatensis]|uniref:LacI family DNA-binding transcriptional regulator n=1 Tax=Streptomyces hoynatensis TaxID=1141874 RepID=UPI00267C5DA1
MSIRDVANAAGVSHQTVSRVINGHPRVRPATRARVEAVIAELGFRRSVAAHALASGRTRSVTVLTANTTHYGRAALLRGVEEAARAASYAVGICVVESEEPRAVRDALDRATDAGGGLIVIAYDEPGLRALEQAPAGLPLVAAVETPAAAPPAASPWVWTDDRRAAREATEHLLGLGHRTVHYLAIPSTTRSRGGSQRAAGWREALTRASAAVPEPVAAGWTPAEGYAAGRRLAADPGVTAVLCGNDDLALGLLRALHEAGRRVPEDVSVVGFDDAPHAAYLAPALTTVRQDFHEVGRVCFGRLHGLIEGGAPVGPHALATPRLTVRESTGPAAPPA